MLHPPCCPPHAYPTAGYFTSPSVKSSHLHATAVEHCRQPLEENRNGGQDMTRSQPLNKHQSRRFAATPHPQRPSRKNMPRSPARHHIVSKFNVVASAKGPGGQRAAPPEGRRMTIIPPREARFRRQVVPGNCSNAGVLRAEK